MESAIFDFFKGNFVAILTFISGVFVAYLTKYLPFKGQQSSDNFKLLIETYQAQYKGVVEELKEYKDREKNCLEKYKELEEQLAKLQSSMLLLKASSPNIPIPMWVKDTNGVMLALNDEYERVFLLPMGKRREDYIGNPDEAIWGEETAAIMKKNDNKVLYRDEAINVFEPIGKEGGDTPIYNIIKYPNRVGDIVVTIGGIAFPIPKEKYKENPRK